MIFIDNGTEKEISNMENIDENLKIKNTAERQRSITDENLLKKAKKEPWIEARVIKIPKDDSDDKKDKLIFLTNLSSKEFNAYEIAGLYEARWEIEVNYDRLKNKMEIENYTGKSEIIIKQDFYSSIYIFNLAMILRNNIKKHERKRTYEHNAIQRFACFSVKEQNSPLAFTAQKTKSP